VASTAQALAAVGQLHLMRHYDDNFTALGKRCAQVRCTARRRCRLTPQPLYQPQTLSSERKCSCLADLTVRDDGVHRRY